MRSAPLLALALCSLASFSLLAAEPKPLVPNSWKKLEEATITGRRYETPLSYSPELKKFLVLGGRASWSDFKKPRSFDQVALDVTSGQWENWFPSGKDWGPKFGPATAPVWKNEKWIFEDTAGNVRPNWSIYGTFSLGHAYDYDPDTKTFLFFAHGKTFRYDPAARTWTDLQPANNPEQEHGGILLWSSLCYDREHKQFVLFGGGNVETSRGDPGTWVYSPAENKWEELKLQQQPPQRANSQLVYDPVAKKVVLFGGDQLSQLVADTWTFDLGQRQWEQLKPDRSPSPRAGHALVWLPKAKRVALIGGYEYTSNTGYVANMYQRLPVEIWTLDTSAGKWQLLQRAAAKTGPAGPANGMWHAAVDEHDVVVTTGEGTWLCQLDASQVDAAGTNEFGVAAGSVQRRTGPYDPAWFTQDVPPPDPQQVTKELANLPANEWVQRPTPKLPRPNMDWGSAVFIPGQDKIVRFSGGHSAYSGTAPIIYDIPTDRYSLAFAPELPIEFVYSNDQVHGEWSFQGNPWMTGHTYKATGYEPHSQTLAFAAHDYTYFFDAKTNKWSRTRQMCPFQPNMYAVTLATTAKGLVAWADWHGSSSDGGLWLLEGDRREWRFLPRPQQGFQSLHEKSADRHGMAYDSKRDRLLFFSAVGKQKGDVAAYDLKTGDNAWLNAAGKERAAVSSRETIYLPEQDAVLIGARVKNADDKFCWLWYDCGKNAWFSVELAGADPISKGEFNNSMGLMYDPARKLVWAVGQNSHVHVLRLDLKQAKLAPL
ncbi:kelch repeat-containing protein [Anatilimnocola sp. NA78]|uniref:Kelch repeat-containing protein n=1 Tax=Anatilimnocola sp. NA78 TaxID=3415683 RepID=UPI003CE5951C